MADYTSSKGIQGAPWLENAVATPWGRLEDLISPEQLKARFLLGIPLVTRTVDPITKKATVITSEMLKDYIQLAVNQAEMESALTIMPTQFSEKKPYSRQDYEQFSFIQLDHKPVVSIESVTVRLADGTDIFTFPNQWIDTGNLLSGQFNMIPLAMQQLAAGNYNNPGTLIQDTSSSGSFFSALWSRDWVPSLFNITYTAGFPNGKVPTVVNELIGCIAAIRVLSMLAALNARIMGQSLSVDSLSQSISGPGAQIYALRIQELQADKDTIIKKLRSVYQSNFIISAL